MRLKETKLKRKDPPIGYRIVATCADDPKEMRMHGKDGEEPVYSDYMNADGIGRMLRKRLEPWFSGVHIKLEPVYR